MEIKNWVMSYDGQSGLACQSPCSLYSVLLEHGLIEDPFYGLNELKSTALCEKDCAFEAVFCADDTMLNREYVELNFLGLDTICDIYLNGALLDQVDDMHYAYRYPVKDCLRAGENRLRLEFHSPIRYFNERNARHYLWGSADCLPGSAHLRKALCMSGWDWGPQLPDMGIFRPVELVAYDGDAIEDVLVLQRHEENCVELEISVASRHGAADGFAVEIAGQRVALPGGRGKVRIENPKLWWARGYGEQNLYDLTVELSVGGAVVDRSVQKIGLRTLTVSTEKDKYGSEFCFVLNGVKIFAMGANYIPQDNLLCRISRARTEKLLRDCVAANYNCIRVWGGGYYPEDDFYELCDELGLLVWQDFMVACANVWLTEDFERNFVREAIYNIKRFRNHPSLCLFCGNNEMEEAVTTWDYTGSNELVKADYLRLYEHILPELVDRYAPQTFYWPSSPSCGGGFDNPTDNLRGDVHYWKVWHGGLPFTDYRNHLFRFCSEYGFESFPSMKTVRTFAEEKDWNAFSRVMENHQKCKSGNGKIVTYIADTYLYPTSFEKLVYTSQLLQADAIRYGVEHFRRIRGVCMGSIYWQVNDCWPVASWSSIDYFGRYKALHYAAKKFYAPVAMGIFLEDGQLALNVSNETMGDFRGSVRYRLCRNDFSVLQEVRADVAVPRLSSLDVLTAGVEAENPYCDYIVATLYDEDGNPVATRTELLVRPKHYEFDDPRIRAEFREKQGGVEITLTADCFARAVEVDFAEDDCVLSDNFFDITGPEGVTVFAETDLPADQLKEQLILRSVYDIGR